VSSPVILKDKDATSCKNVSSNSISASVFSVIRPTLMKIRHGYWWNNWLEFRRNKELLRRARENVSTKVNPKPLISVVIPTYNLGRILADRAVSSVLRQTYQNFELIIVGDHCTDDTEKILKELNDQRIKFVNLTESGEYPSDRVHRWFVAGSLPANKGIDLASGEWIACLDDDDTFSDDHLEVLLNNAVKNDCEMVYGVIEAELEGASSVNVGSLPIRRGNICRLSVLYHSKLKFFKYDITAWKYMEPGDWNMWRRMKEAGVRIGFVDKVVGKHYLASKRS
jgi:glycosyltransferase involved in cell wall biosynthesis